MPILALNDVQNVTEIGLARRNLQTTLTPTPTQKVTLIVAGCYIVVIAILWYVIVWFIKIHSWLTVI